MCVVRSRSRLTVREIGTDITCERPEASELRFPTRTGGIYLLTPETPLNGQP